MNLSSVVFFEGGASCVTALQEVLQDRYPHGWSCCAWSCLGIPTYDGIHTKCIIAFARLMFILMSFAISLHLCLECSDPRVHAESHRKWILSLDLIKFQWLWVSVRTQFASLLAHNTVYKQPKCPYSARRLHGSVSLLFIYIGQKIEMFIDNCTWEAIN